MTSTKKSTPTQIRKAQCERAAARSDSAFTGPELFHAAYAVWSNLNPQSVSFDRALSVAIVALRAAAKERAS